MKKRVLKVLSTFMLMFSFFLTGCIETADLSSFEAPSAEVQGASENANEIMKTANNVTYYYDNLIDLNNDKGLEAIDRSALDNCFSDAYLFVDPGSEHEFNDHFSGSVQPFYRLVDREIDILSQALYELINAVYITNPATATDVITGSTNVLGGTFVGNFNYNTTNITIPAEKKMQINDLQIIDATTEYEDAENTIISKKGVTELTDSTFDLYNIATLGVVANVLTNADAVDKVDNFYVSNVSVTGIKADSSTETINIPINNYMVDLEGAIFGGKELKIVNTITIGETVYNIRCVDFSEDSYNESFKWQFMTNYSLNSASSDIGTKLKQELKYRIASAVSGKEVTGVYDESKYLEIVKSIDHMGFTEQDQTNIKSQILNNIIGTDNITIDNSYISAINTYFSVTGSSLGITNSSLISSLFIEDGGESEGASSENSRTIHGFQNYKAYEFVIDELVEQAAKISTTYINDDGTNGKTETLVPTFPRLQIMVVDSRIFMDAIGYEEENGEVDDYEDIDPDEIPTDTEGTEFTKKLLQTINLKAVLFLPKQVYGERTIAKKDGDTWVEDEDGEQVYDTFIVQGFVVTDVDVVLLTDEGNKAVVQGNYTTKNTVTVDSESKTTVITKQSEAFEVASEMPDPTVEETYNSTSFLEIDGTEFLALKEEDPFSETDPTTPSSLRMQGYNGCVIGETGIVVDTSSEDGILVPVSIATQSKLGLYDVFTLSTNMYKYLSIDSVVGTGAGYSLNVDNFAGDNYVLVDFSVLQVNDDESNRECKFNILYLSCETA